MTGATSASAHSRAIARTACCSGVRSKFMAGPARIRLESARRPSGGGRGVPSSAQTSSPRAPPRSGASACPPIPPRRGVRSPPRLRRGRLARRRCPALRGALRLVGFAPDGTPLPPPDGRMRASSYSGPERTRNPAHAAGTQPMRSYGSPDVVADEADDVLGRGPRGEQLLDPHGLERGDVLGRDDPAAENHDILCAFLAQQFQDALEEVVVGPREDGEPDRVGVFLDGRRHDLLRRLVEAGIDDLEARVAECARHDLGAAIMPVQSGLGDHEPYLPLAHDPRRSRWIVRSAMAIRTWRGYGPRCP